MLVLQPADALDVVGPAEVFTLANLLHEGSPYRFELVSAGATTDLETESRITIKAHKTLAEVRRSRLPIDTLIVTAGFKPLTGLTDAAMRWLRRVAPEARRVCAICVGAFVLAEAGLLDGRRATTHWRMTRQLAERYPRVKVEPEPIWIKDGAFYTSAGIAAGIDLALGLVAEDLGDPVALDIARNLVLFLRRPGGQAQFSVALQSQQGSASRLAELCVWIGEHLHLDLSTETLADRLATSVRTAIRMFRRELNTTPARYVEDVRLEAARRALELGGQTMEDIARQCGYSSVAVLRKAFLRRPGVTPREYAARFMIGQTQT
ncbi:GlxA family transcriptional regulator [Bordetella genomosp. 8]|nr:helix-turn-helix domain-containing protein [Bordetella genomosp. 8]